MCPTRHVMVTCWVSNPLSRYFAGLLLRELFYSLLLRPTYGSKLKVIMAKNAAATKRNNRKIHARKLLVMPEGQARLERKKAEAAELKIVAEARKFL